jgi:hypothetical protein
MSVRVLSAAASAVVVAVVAAGCGGARAGSLGSASLGGAAAVAPANAVAFVSVDTSLSSPQWQAIDDLLTKFPAHDKLLSELQRQFEQDTKLSWNDDVKPALGAELDVALLPGGDAVGFIQPADEAKFDALLTKLDAKLVSRRVGDWTAFAENGATLDTVAQASAKLANDTTYGEAAAKLEGDALVHVYANGAEAQKLLASLPGQAQTPPPGGLRLRLGRARSASPPATQQFDWAAAEVVAENDGVKVQAYARRVPLSGAALQGPSIKVPTTPYTAHLVDEIPAGALLVADFPVQPGEFALADASRLPKMLRGILAPPSELGHQLDAILGGETALYVRPGLPIPEVTLVTQPNDTSRALAALDALTAKLRQSAGGSSGSFGLGSLPLYHDVTGGQLIVSTSRQGISDFLSGGAKLSSDGTFEEAQQASSMPAQTTGFLYVNLKDSLPLVQTLAPLAGVTLPSALQGGNLQALRTLTAFVARSGNDMTFTAFLEIK